MLLVLYCDLMHDMFLCKMLCQKLLNKFVKLINQSNCIVYDNN